MTIEALKNHRQRLKEMAALAVLVDSMEDIEQLEILRTKYQGLMALHAAEGLAIERLIDTRLNQTERAVMRAYYLDPRCRTWEQVADDVHFCARHCKKIGQKAALKITRK